MQFNGAVKSGNFTRCVNKKNSHMTKTLINYLNLNNYHYFIFKTGL